MSPLVDSPATSRPARGFLRRHKGVSDENDAFALRHVRQQHFEQLVRPTTEEPLRWSARCVDLDEIEERCVDQRCANVTLAATELEPVAAMLAGHRALSWLHRRALVESLRRRAARARPPMAET